MEVSWHCLQDTGLAKLFSAVKRRKVTYDLPE